jgi:predicted component of type VI protein secretion system
MGQSAARLEVMAGNATGMSILVDDELVIGRHAEGAGRLADDEEISRLHARVSLDVGGFCAIEDLGSTNGTYVNGLKISSPRLLSEGDMIEIGQTTLAVRELPQAPTEALAAEATAGESAHQATVVPAPVAAEPPVMPTPPPPALSLRLQVDLIEREARIFLDEASEPLRLVFDDGSWRFVPSPPSEQGGPA